MSLAIPFGEKRVKCEHEATWVFHPSNAEQEMRIRMVITLEIPIQGEEGVSASILLAYELFPDQLSWEAKDKLRSSTVNGFHIGFGFAELPRPAGGIDIIVTALEIAPAPDQLDGAELERLAVVLYWGAASVATSSWRGLHTLASG